MHESRFVRTVDWQARLEHARDLVQSANTQCREWARSVDWAGHVDHVRKQADRAVRAVQSFDWQRLPNLESLNLRAAAIIVAVCAVVITSAAWTIRAKPWLRHTVAAEAAVAAPAPVLTGLAPKTKIRAQDEEQAVPLTGRDLVQGLSVTISSPDGLVTTYGAESLGDVTDTRLTIRAVFEIPGTYHLVVRTPRGTRSNEISFFVDR